MPDSNKIRDALPAIAAILNKKIAKVLGYEVPFTLVVHTDSAGYISSAESTVAYDDMVSLSSRIIHGTLPGASSHLH
jgi:hypothetical protein